MLYLCCTHWYHLLVIICCLQSTVPFQKFPEEQSFVLITYKVKCIKTTLSSGKCLQSSILWHLDVQYDIIDGMNSSSSSM